MRDTPARFLVSRPGRDLKPVISDAAQNISLLLLVTVLAPPVEQAHFSAAIIPIQPEIHYAAGQSVP